MSGRLSNEFLAFYDYNGFSFIENKKTEILDAINNQSDDYILNVNKEEYIAHIVSEFTITPLIVHEEQLTVSTYEAKIPAASHPFRAMIISGV